MRLKLIWAILVDELFQKSKHKGLGSDTLKRCCLTVVTFVGFYFLVYHYDEQAVRFDQWLNEVFGWELSSVPSARKIEWHRLMAGGLSSVTIVAAVGEYSVCLWRRIKARRQESDR
ncbi:MAG: hypothetical protein Q7T69_07240, partial [Rhodoferax sp.]|nr:hypothetical protein [Rhodoferax sp.]